MKHPLSKKVYDVAKVFYDLVELDEKGDYELVVDMESPDITRFSCYTTACHAGWYGFMKSRGVWKKVEPFTTRYCVGTKMFFPSEESVGSFGHRNFTNMMAKDLGFEDYNALTDWAHYNPRIWGNEKGASMFCEAEAFDYDFISLRDIADHWTRVGDRLKEIEDETSDK